MTFDEIPLTRKPHERGYNQELADFCGVDVRRVEQWKQRKRIPENVQRLIKYKLHVIAAVGELAEKVR